MSQIGVAFANTCVVQLDICLYELREARTCAVARGWQDLNGGIHVAAPLEKKYASLSECLRSSQGSW